MRFEQTNSQPHPPVCHCDGVIKKGISHRLGVDVIVLTHCHSIMSLRTFLFNSVLCRTDRGSWTKCSCHLW